MKDESLSKEIVVGKRSKPKGMINLLSILYLIVKKIVKIYNLQDPSSEKIKV